MEPDHEVQEAEARACEMLAQLDARNTPTDKLMVIFQTDADGLRQAREEPSYKAAFAQEVLLIETRAMQTDNSWDDIEAKMLADLAEVTQLGGIADPSMMLKTAMIANKAGRRAANRSPDAGQGRAGEGPATLDGNNATVIKLRTRVVKRINTEAGHESIVEREAAIMTTDRVKMDETMTPDQMHRHIQESLGTDGGDQRPQGHFGPDDMEIDLDPAMFKRKED